MRYVWRGAWLICLAFSCGQGCDPQNFLAGINGQASDGESLHGINGGESAGAVIPEIGGKVSVQIISRSATDARVLVRYFVDGWETHRSELGVPAFVTLAPVGPDQATHVEVSGTFVDGRPIPLVRLALGQDFTDGDLREVILLDPDDQCPQDPEKMKPGLCGCGLPDTDTDGDGVPDCVDQCPGDPGKNTPGACGCGQPDSDTDGDGAVDCQDACPEDPAKTALASGEHCGPAVCGDGTCEVGEDSSTCPQDCRPPSVCGDGVCQPDEDQTSCYQDCNIAQVFKEVTSATAQITLFARDEGIEDGDRVDILLNGGVVIDNYTLTSKGVTFNLTLIPGRNTLDSRALNTGELGLNTAGFVIRDARGQQLVGASWQMETGQISRLIVIYQP